MSLQGVAPVLDNPPVIETVLGVQFAPIPGFTGGHFGWYWKNFLDSSWVKTLEVSPMPDQFEKFGEQRTWNLPSLQLTTHAGPNRLQIINAEDDRVIQIQNNRFIYNWRKQQAHYPSFKEIYPEFLDKLTGFREFLRVAGLEDISANQWEITYINHIPKGELWESPEEWYKVLPGLFPPPRQTNLTRLESGSVEWHYEIPPKLGRLHVKCQHGRSQDKDTDILVLEMTARGGVNPEDLDRGLRPGLELGHRVSVQTFADLASEVALKHWGAR